VPNNIKQSLDSISEIDGVMCTALVDSQTGFVMGKEGTGVDVELAAAGNSEVVKAKLRIMNQLGIKGGIEDILITLNKQYHIIRPTAVQEGVFFYVVLDRARANLALARMGILKVEKNLML
jgi:predicted regulator of Ras-like GTPase activity (Roadblock/LC7/MglB family)